jgi:hypothetical protein
MFFLLPFVATNDTSLCTHMSEDELTETGSAIKLRVPTNFKAEVEDLALEMHISVSALTRLALGEYIKSHKSEVAPAPIHQTAEVTP